MILQAPPGSYRAASWPEELPADQAPGRKRPRFDETGRSAPAAASARQEAPGWRHRLPAIQEKFNSCLQNTLNDALLLLADQVRPDVYLFQVPTIKDSQEVNCWLAMLEVNIRHAVKSSGHMPGTTHLSSSPARLLCRKDKASAV